MHRILHRLASRTGARAGALAGLALAALLAACGGDGALSRSGGEHPGQPGVIELDS